MNTKQYTPEPWHVVSTGDDLYAIIDREGFYIATRLFKSDAERIVKCVNACAGIEDPAAYIALDRSQKSKLLDFIAAKDAIIAELRVQRDEAVKALEKAIVDLRITSQSNSYLTTFYYEDTLTKIKGGQDDPNSEI